ncbi:MAG: ribosome-associated translation inhibitor RaiA [Candidatus Latescibacteria bacterium]|jgi:putative sigma-54 modulation protein|nr:ribosome-associated translation inhibitor RaiA [Candidatus Latescibacterota bacterium]
MQISITARHFELAQSHKSHAEEQLKRLSRFVENIINADLTVTLEKYRYTAEMNIKVGGAMLVSKEEAAELFPAIDNAADKMARQLKKHNAKLHNHRVKKEALPQVEEDPESDA